MNGGMNSCIQSAQRTFREIIGVIIVAAFTSLIPWTLSLAVLGPERAWHFGIVYLVMLGLHTVAFFVVHTEGGAAEQDETGRPENRRSERKNSRA